MSSISLGKRLAASLICSALLGQPLQADAEHRDKGRAGLDELSNEMSTCAAYFSLFSSVIKSSAAPERKAPLADQMKSAGQAMLTQAINIATYIGMDDSVAMQRVELRLKEMVESINSDPANSLRMMHTKYGQPCDQLLRKAPERFLKLLKDYAG